MPAADGTIKISINNRNEIISNLTKRNFHNNWNSLVSETTFFAYLFQVLVFEVRLSQLFQWREWKYESPGWEFWWRLLKVLSDIYFSQCFVTEQLAQIYNDAASLMQRYLFCLYWLDKGDQICCFLSTWIQLLWLWMEYRLLLVYAAGQWPRCMAPPCSLSFNMCLCWKFVTNDTQIFLCLSTRLSICLFSKTATPRRQHTGNSSFGALLKFV